MRLHLDTNNAAGSAETANPNSPLTAAAKSTTTLTGSGSVTSDSGSRDSVAVSSASSAWSASFSDRADRVGQLAAAVQNGTYHVASAAIGQSIVASAIAY